MQNRMGLARLKKLRTFFCKNCGLYFFADAENYGKFSSQQDLNLNLRSRKQGCWLLYQYQASSHLHSKAGLEPRYFYGCSRERGRLIEPTETQGITELVWSEKPFCSSSGPISFFQVQGTLPRLARTALGNRSRRRTTRGWPQKAIANW